MTLGFFFAFGAFLNHLSGKERTNAAVAAAVLRHRAQGYSNDQISIFKDRPEFQNCTSTLRLLDSMKTYPTSLYSPNPNA